jgi:hypothetical protein
LSRNIFSFARVLTSALDSNIHPLGYLTLDLARGKEAIPIPVYNTVDQDMSPLDDTQYVVRPKLPRSMMLARLTVRLRCCAYPVRKCGGGCKSSSSSCACVKRNGGGVLPYNTDGTLVRGIIFENNYFS